MLTKIIYKNFRSNLKNYILFFLSNIVAIMELFVFRGLKEIVLQIVKDTETAFLFRIDFTIALGMISVITIMLMAYAMIYYLKSRIRDYGLFIMMGMHKRMVFSLMLISIARALLKDSPIILLDEATASLDPENEVFVQKALAHLIKGKTVIMIAHRLRTVVDADQILVMENGKIVEHGTHNELMERKGLYHKLYSIQQESLGWSV